MKTEAVIVVALLMSATSAAQAVTVRTTCQKNLDDGRILVQDYRALPSENSTFKVLSFKAARTSDGWAYGPCTLNATK